MPYYKKLFDQVKLIKNGNVVLKNFTKTPPLTKNDIKRNYDQLLSPKWKELGGKESTSGGSTGETVTVVHGTGYRALNLYANKLYFNNMLGKEMGEKEINLWGSKRDIARGSIGFKAKVTNYLYNRVFLNSYILTRENLDEFTKKINLSQPKSILCYVESVYELAKYIKKNKKTIYSPDLIIATAGTLYPQIREYVEEVFHTKVYNQYGSIPLKATM